jgi:hypothetical protein
MRVVNLGDQVKDVVTGLTGIAVARTEWINKCVRLCIQPQELKDGKPVDNYTVDEEQCEVVTPSAVRLKKQRQTGGPNDDKAAQRR